MHFDSGNSTAIGPVLGLVVVACTLLGLGLGYIGLCAYFATRADRLAPAATTAVPAPQTLEVVPMPFNWLVPAVVAIVLGFTPCAVASLVHASRVGMQHRAGRIDAARESARLARVWFWWSVAIGIGLIVVFSALPVIASIVAR
jgi:hypothetical protein